MEDKRKGPSQEAVHDNSSSRVVPVVALAGEVTVGTMASHKVR